MTKLLQFAKPEEYAECVERHRPQDVVSDCLPLVQHLMHRSEIGIAREDTATRYVFMNRTELQQVLVNLMVNAIHAMPDGGSLTLRTFDSLINEKSGVSIEVRDTGVRMSSAVAERGMGAPSDNPRLAERAALMSRAAKRDIDRDELSHLWQRQATDLGFDAVALGDQAKAAEPAPAGRGHTGVRQAPVRRAARTAVNPTARTAGSRPRRRWSGRWRILPSARRCSPEPTCSRPRSLGTPAR